MQLNDLIIAGNVIEPGEHKTIELPAASLYTHTPITIPVHVIHGKKTGPRLLVIAAIHGDEINGVEIIRRLLKSLHVKQLNGALIAVPIANVYGFINLSRYLPDHRDLNRSFPGSQKGSLAARLANLFMTEIVSQCTHGIDLHSGIIHRTNLPQIRVNLKTQDAEQLAKAFNVPVIIHSNLRDGSLRQAGNELGIPILVYEAGEALRFDDTSIRVGVNGILNVMQKLNMLQIQKKVKPVKPLIARSSTWIRAPHSGIVHPNIKLGDQINKNDALAIIADPFGSAETIITSPVAGMIIGKNNLPLVNEGDALFHIACFKKPNINTSKTDESFSDIEIVNDH